MTTPLPDATELATLVRSGQASPGELVDDAIARVERLDPTINAVIHERFEAARSEARGELPDGPFRGVPFLVKDLGCEMAGEPHTLGNRALRDADVRAEQDSYLYRSIRDAGFVTLGRTNTPELGGTITTEPEAFGPSRNPWNPDHSTGGSSGGSAAAVAAGMVPMAHASDGGGSIRVPASECGLVGLKPSRGRISHGPTLGEGWAGATTDGVVSRSVRDTAAMLDVMSGRRTGDPYVAAPPTRPFADEVGVDPGRLRIGLAPSHAGVQTDPECVAAVEAAGSLLEQLGHDVEVAQPAAFFDEQFSRHFVTIVAVATAVDFVNMGEAIGRPIGEVDVEASNWLMGSIGRSISAADYIASVNWVHAWSRRLQAWWDEFDVLVSPVIAVPPPPIGWLSDPEHGTERLTSILQFTAQFNVSGQPAVSLPLHWSDTGLPVGVQFVGPIDDEALLIRLAAQLETAAPWANRLPPVYG
ncbi:MAG: amidase [Acidobacteriota bacterium]